MKVSRRVFVRTLVLSTSGVVLGACGPDSSGEDGGQDAGVEVMVDAGSPASELRLPLAQVPVGTVVAVGSSGCVGAESGALVGRDSGGVYAFSSACTHQHGTVATPDAQGVARCCLHGAEYDRYGVVTKAIVPGQANLPHLAVRLEGTTLVIDTRTTVDPSTRTAV
jgi:Rieske Fe-S protein